MSLIAVFRDVLGDETLVDMGDLEKRDKVVAEITRVAEFWLKIFAWTLRHKGVEPEYEDLFLKQKGKAKSKKGGGWPEDAVWMG